MITQQTFDTIYRGLAGQDWEQSYDGGIDQCVYRARSGRKCAIGHLIPDDRYTPRMDDPLAGVFGCHSFHMIGLLTDLTVDEFNELQQTHDSADGPEDMRIRFEDLAGKYGLTVPVLA